MAVHRVPSHQKFHRLLFHLSCKMSVENMSFAASLTAEDRLVYYMQVKASFDKLFRQEILFIRFMNR